MRRLEGFGIHSFGFKALGFRIRQEEKSLASEAHLQRAEQDDVGSSV